MKKIYILSVTALKEKLFIAFMLIVLDIIDQFEVLNEKLGYYVQQFKAAYNHLNKVYLKYDLKFYTEQVQDCDNKRCIAFRKLRDMVRYNFTYPVDNEKGEAARILLEIIKLYGSDVAAMKINERTTVLTNLIEDYEDKYNTQVEAIGVGALLAGLRQAQEKFMEVYLARTEVDTELGLGAMVDARKRMTDAYRDLVTMVNMAAKRDEEGKYTEFINMMNVEIRKQFIHTGQNANSSSSQAPVTPTPPEDENPGDGNGENVDNDQNPGTGENDSNTPGAPGQGDNGEESTNPGGGNTGGGGVIYPGEPGEDTDL